MPELPEVETTLRGIRPHLLGRRIQALIVREARLRLPIPAELPLRLAGREIQGVSRRGKYLLIEVGNGADGSIGPGAGCLILHLGMSGSLRLVGAEAPPLKHDHLDLVLTDQRALRLHDPRRFGLLIWSDDPPAIAVLRHPLLRDLGPEPLEDGFDGDHLYRLSRARRVAVKAFVMDGGVVVGVGNIYASESLFLAGIHPARPCNRIGPESYRRLAQAIRAVLAASITQGGTTLRDFVQEDGNPGYFAQSLRVYGRTGQPCPGCGEAVRQRRIGQRSSFYCPRCQR
jgi:formamidopyrimidine-DNA glycosylase